MLENPFAGKQASKTVKDGLENLSASKDHLASTEGSIVTKPNLKHGYVNSATRNVKGEFLSAYYDSSTAIRLIMPRVFYFKVRSIFQ